MNYDSAERQQSFKNSMVTMWGTMSRLYHPQWTKTNGEIGGGVFQDWSRELLPTGPDGVLRGLQAVRDAGNVYMPNLNKFLADCRNGSAESPGGARDAFGRRPRATPNGVPMSLLADGEHSAATLLESDWPEDQQAGAEMRRMNINSYQEYRKQKCLQKGINYATGAPL